ncbi:MAG TPA: hypothetical protein VLF63_02070 [Patescibacteria group bacterium]|nr:hypothetical protein [Patescibacteria group bacterium]
MLTFGRVLANKFRHGINYANFRGFFLVLLLGSSIGLVQTLCWPQITFSTAGTKATHFIEFTQKKAIQPNPSLATSTTSAAPRNTSLTPLCTPYISYSLPSHLTPTNPGLQIILDNLNNYVIYGNSLSQIKYQAARCTPVKTSGTGGISAPFAASTANTIDWKTVNSYNENTDTCKVSSVSITLHINQVSAVAINFRRFS